MNFYSLNKELAGHAERLEEEGVLPRTRAECPKYRVLGIFNDINDECGYQMFRLRTVSDMGGAAGEVSIGWDETPDTVRTERRGVRLVANADEYHTTVYMVPIDSPLGMDSDPQELEMYPSVMFNSDGSDYPNNLKKLVRLVRASAK